MVVNTKQQLENSPRTDWRKYQEPPNWLQSPGMQQVNNWPHGGGRNQLLISNVQKKSSSFYSIPGFLKGLGTVKPVDENVGQQCVISSSVGRCLVHNAYTFFDQQQEASVFLPGICTTPLI